MYSRLCAQATSQRTGQRCLDRQRRGGEEEAERRKREREELRQVPDLISLLGRDGAHIILLI